MTLQPNAVTKRLQGMAKNKSVPATVIDVGGHRVTVRLHGGGRLTGITYSGDTPIVGSEVYVGYQTGRPVVEGRLR
jgi:hypothetical protein